MSPDTLLGERSQAQEATYATSHLHEMHRPGNRKQIGGCLGLG